MEIIINSLFKISFNQITLIFNVFLLSREVSRIGSYIKHNVLKTESVIEPEKLPVHGSLVGKVVELRLNR